MVTYVVGEGGEGGAGEGQQHQVDHPPMFACREHKSLLRFSARFVDELLSAAQDVMPGNPDEIATAFLREAGPAFRLPEFLIPPKLFLFNPRGLRGAEALPYAVVLVDRKFFGIPARYLTADRFEGCEDCAEELAHRRPPPAAARPAPPRAPSAPPRVTGESGVRRLDESGTIRRPAPPGHDPRRAPTPPPGGARPPTAPPRPASRPGAPGPGRPAPRPPQR